MRYGIVTEQSENGLGQWVAVWSGAFMSTFEGQGLGRPGAKQITISLEWRDKVVVKLPEGVTFPRTDENYTEIDDAINAAINEHLKEEK